MQKTWSFWERQFYPQHWDLIVVGGGFCGLSMAYHFQKQNPLKKVLLLERDVLAEGASSKNAGFACYGTVGEYLSDVKLMGAEAALQLIERRIHGLNFLKALVGASQIDWQQLGGTELFFQDQREEWEAAQTHIEALNKTFGKYTQDALYQTDSETLNRGILGSIYSPLEAQLDPVKALVQLRKLVTETGVRILNAIEVQAVESNAGAWQLETNQGIWQATQVVFATNAFGLPGYNLDLKPARNQVLVTQPFDHGLKPGNYHARKGYIYFRTIGDRLLIGGARHLALEAETTSQMGLTTTIQDYLQQFLTNDLAMGDQWKIESQWSGIIATGNSKEPLMQSLEPGLWYCGRFGGMGVALSTQFAAEAVKVLEGN
ncbi:NAD(P)/FAD-dependent oxidoreductase [Croceimicrobium hydrocarbonivorans]|uniref:FAD-binding oxidoreductase n=1 Tax=Croceimicrobium hydrocarbonivorans TaxID=2761580 RepID=A0A7H0VEM4_9FLAO|nr:FAD-dependent oxidoreductase [Croceimicrobium hydrocarbonivorans]QNR24172.1 FAD-binding oxidoreductase [Croceimicrobium hydrocarbonivorans]